MGARVWGWLVVALVVAVAPVAAQVDEHRGKVIIRSLDPDDALTLSGGILASTSLAGTLVATVRNNFGGTTGATEIRVANDVSAFGLALGSLSSGFTPSGLYQPNISYVLTSLAGGLTVGTDHASGTLRFVAGGATRVTMATGGQLQAVSGSAATPTYSFSADTTTGAYLQAAGEYAIAASGAPILSIRKFTGGNGNNAILPSAAVGTGANSGGYVQVGRNTSGNGAPGAVSLEARNGSIYAIWADTTGVIRTQTGSSGPTEAAGDTGGTVVGTQTSTRASKDVIGQVTNTAAAMSIIRATPVYQFTYKSGAFNGETFFGIITDESPIFGMDGGKSFNPVTAFGATVLALRNLDARVAALEARQ